VDAVRWVLGEQSARALRGARMDDVIFAGNAHRRPLGMAEVTLTFDNSDGALATPFSEIAITRRAYRTGESEFFINKTAVRLRDITDMLLGTGLAAELAAIVSQGEIDTILSAKPEARRELFEGVAGTARYRARKREAQRRLEQTAQNALRVNDLLTELEKQLPQIEQQVRRAKRYHKVAQQLRDLEILSYVRKSHDRRAERTSIVASLGVDERRAAEVAAAHAALAAQLSEARDREYQASLALDEASESHTRIAQELQGAASGHAAAAAKTTELARSIEALEHEADVYAQAVAEAETSLARAIEDLRTSRELRDTALGVAESAAADEAARTGEWERAYAELRAVEDRRARVVASATESSTAAAAASAEGQRLADAVERMDADLKAVQDASRRAQAKSQNARADAERMAGEIAQLQRDQAGAAREAASAHEALDRERKACASAHDEVTKLQAKLDALAQFGAGFGGSASGARDLTDAGDAGTLRGVIGTVASQIAVDPKHSPAIAALLGQRANDVIVRSLADAKAAVELLKERKGGRTTILVLEVLAKEQIPDTARSKVARREGVIGRAAELVQCDPSVRPAIELILGDAFVASDLKSAFACAAEFAGAAFATREGDVIRGGVITSGVGTGALGARAALEADIERAAARAQAADVTLARAAAASRASAERSEALARQIVEFTLRKHEAESLAEQAGAEHTTHEERFSRLALERSAALARAADIKETLARHQAATDALAAPARSIETQRQEALNASDRLAAVLAGVRAKHRDAAANAAALVERVAQLGDDVEAARRQIERAETQRKERTAALGRSRAELETCRSEAERFAAARATAEKCLEAAAGRLGELRAARDAAQQRARELDEAHAGEEQAGKARSMELERQRIRLAEIDAELALLAQTFSQNPAPAQECDEVAARYADFQDDPDAQVRKLREEMVRLGNVNLGALEDRAATLERCEFLRAQLHDLESARANIVASIAEMDAESLRQFNEVFAKVAVAFSETFTRLFNGGQAKIWVADAADPTEAGIEISAQPPGKKMQNLNLLSGGERALTAVALIFATLQVRPSPFYIFDEIDAALDEANIGRFGVQLGELTSAGGSQIIIITHNKATMTLVDRMYGVTMSEPGVSNILSLSLERAGAAG